MNKQRQRHNRQCRFPAVSGISFCMLGLMLLVAACQTPVPVPQLSAGVQYYVYKANGRDDQAQRAAQEWAEAELRRRIGNRTIDALSLQEAEELRDFLDRRLALNAAEIRRELERNHWRSMDRDRVVRAAAETPAVDGDSVSATWRSTRARLSSRILALKSQRILEPISTELPQWRVALEESSRSREEADRRWNRSTARLSALTNTAAQVHTQMAPIVEQLRGIDADLQALGITANEVRDLYAQALRLSLWAEVTQQLAPWEVQAERLFRQTGHETQGDRLTRAVEQNLSTIRLRIQEERERVGGSQEIIQGLEQRVGRLLAESWAHEIWQFGQNKEYWQAYERTTNRVAEWGQLSEGEKSEAGKILIEAYANLIPDALDYHNQKASDYRLNNLFGSALTLGRMNDELIDYYRSFRRGRQIPPLLQNPWRVSTSRRDDDRARLAQEVGRGIWVRDFGGESHGRRFSAMLRDKLRYENVDISDEQAQPDSPSLTIAGDIYLLDIEYIPPVVVSTEVELKDWYGEYQARVADKRQYDRVHRLLLQTDTVASRKEVRFHYEIQMSGIEGQSMHELSTNRIVTDLPGMTMTVTNRQVRYSYYEPRYNVTFPNANPRVYMDSFGVATESLSTDGALANVLLENLVKEVKEQVDKWMEEYPVNIWSRAKADPSPRARANRLGQAYEYLYTMLDGADGREGQIDDWIARRQKLQREIDRLWGNQTEDLWRTAVEAVLKDLEE